MLFSVLHNKKFLSTIAHMFRFYMALEGSILFSLEFRITEKTKTERTENYIYPILVMSCNVIYIDLEVKIRAVVIYSQIKISKQQ